MEIFANGHWLPLAFAGFDGYIDAQRSALLDGYDLASEC